MTVHQTDVAVIGAGPVGLFAIFELGMVGLNCHVLDSLAATGGQCVALYPEKPIYDIPALPIVTGQELTDRLFMPMLLEATRTLEDNIVRDPRDIDLGLIFGLGFPPFKGGLMCWADRVGAAALVEKLKPLESVGVRMLPTNLLLEKAKTGKKFYPSSH